MNLRSAKASLVRTVLDNGITVLVWENPAADIIASRIFIRAGSRWERQQQAGLSHLLSAVLTKGTGDLSSFEIAERIESVGASLSADSTTDYFLLSLKTVSSDFEEVLALAADLLRSPSFPPQEIELERRLAIQAIRSQQEQPFTVAFDQLRQIMYGDHPYALSGLGTEESVAQLQREDLVKFHQTHFRPDNVVISLSGRIDPDTAVGLIEKIFGDWQIPALPTPNLSLPLLTPNPVRAVIPQETQQSIVMLGYLAPAISKYQATPELQTTDTDPHNSLEDYVALKLLNSYLGNGLSSRLFVELREKRGLAYEVSAFYPTRLEPAQFVAYMGTSPDNTEIAMDGLKAEVDRLRDAPLAEEEIQAAKNKVLGQYALGKQTNAQIAQIYGWYETLGLGIDFDRRFQEEVAIISADVAHRVAQNYLTQPYISLVGPEAVVKGLLTPL